MEFLWSIFLKLMGKKNKQIDGQLSLTDWSPEPIIHDVDIMGICDDAYCPMCGISLDEYRHLDCEECPECGVRIRWDNWHRANDEEMEKIFGEKWREHLRR